MLIFGRKIGKIRNYRIEARASVFQILARDAAFWAAFTNYGQFSYLISITCQNKEWVFSGRTAGRTKYWIKLLKMCTSKVGNPYRFYYILHIGFEFVLFVLSLEKRNHYICWTRHQHTKCKLLYLNCVWQYHFISHLHPHPWSMAYSTFHGMA